MLTQAAAHQEQPVTYKQEMQYNQSRSVLQSCEPHKPQVSQSEQEYVPWPLHKSIARWGFLLNLVPGGQLLPWRITALPQAGFGPEL